MSKFSHKKKHSMACPITETRSSRLAYYRERAARVKPQPFGDEEEVRKESLEVLELFRRAREEANRLAEHDEE